MKRPPSALLLLASGVLADAGRACSCARLDVYLAVGGALRACVSVRLL